MAISKSKIHDLVEIFYQAPFKTFNINSLDGKNFVKPFGVFVSLGITTSLNVLKDIKNVLSRVEGGKYTTKLIELRSVNIASQFLNSVSSTDEESLTQYDMEKYPEKYWNKSESYELLEELRRDPEKTLEASQLEKLLQKLSGDPWEDIFIYNENNEYKIFHTKVNYRKDPDGYEYRLGIYVAEN